MDREKVIKGLEHCTSFDDGRDKFGGVGKCGGCPYYGHDCTDRMKADALAMLKEHEIKEPHPWEHIWDAPDYTFKGRCRNCGFIQYFIQGHDAQYRFCPQCGEQKVI